MFGVTPHCMIEPTLSVDGYKGAGGPNFKFSADGATPQSTWGMLYLLS